MAATAVVIGRVTEEYKLVSIRVSTHFLNDEGAFRITLPPDNANHRIDTSFNTVVGGGPIILTSWPICSISLSPVNKGSPRNK